MNDDAKTKLQEMIDKHGPTVIEDRQRCEGLLLDYLGNFRRESAVIINALKDDIPSDLVSSKSLNVPFPALRENLIRRLQDSHAMEKEAAEWAVDTWKSVLTKKVIVEQTIQVASFCDQCGTPLLPGISVCPKCNQQKIVMIPPPLPPPTTKWKAIAVVSIVLLIFSVIGWIASYSKVSDSRDDYKHQYENSELKVNELRTEANSLRDRLAAIMPITLGEVKLRNEQSNGTPIGDYGTVFNSSSLRFLAFETTLVNNAASPVTGTVSVKYVRPNNEFITYPGGAVNYSFSENVTIDRNWVYRHSLGNATQSVYSVGDYTLEFYWNDRFIGKAAFKSETGLLDNIFNN